MKSRVYGKPVIWHSDDPLSAAALTPSKVTVAVRVCEPHERPVRSLPVKDVPDVVPDVDFPLTVSVQEAFTSARTAADMPVKVTVGLLTVSAAWLFASATFPLEARLYDVVPLVEVIANAVGAGAGTFTDVVFLVVTPFIL